MLLQRAFSERWTLQDVVLGTSFSIPEGVDQRLIQVSGLEIDLGRINDPSAPVGEARVMLEHVAELAHPDCHLAHLGLKHEPHNQLAVVPSLEQHSVFAVDGVNYPAARQIVPAVFVGDCAVIAVFGEERRGMIHTGWSEVLDGAIPAFFNLWQRDKEETQVLISPCIGGGHLELGGEVIERIREAGFGQFIGPSAFGETFAFELLEAIVFQLTRAGVPWERIWGNPDINTFDDMSFASDRRERRMGEGHYSWRDAYFIQL